MWWSREYKTSSFPCLIPQRNRNLPGLPFRFRKKTIILWWLHRNFRQKKLKQDLLERQELYAADLKPALAAFDLHDVPEEMRTRFFDRTIAAYLLQSTQGSVSIRGYCKKTIWD